MLNSCVKKWSLFVVLLAVLLSIAYQFFSKKSLPDNAIYYQPAKLVYNFELTDHKGNIFNNASLRGKWSWIFLGYTSCPDVCPTTLQNLGFIYQDLVAVAKNTQVLFVSVDPNRDTQTRLNQYINYFNDEFFALRAGHDTLFPFTQNLGLMYAITDNSSPEGYLVDHSASMVLINPQGRIAALLKPEHATGQVSSINGKDLVADFSKIVALY